ncbi:hypothetical protein J3R83DRAFT_7498 [Lanmaoa asiatica]|nr:hypothetical protein J3R83DRAFT_7498 [Lanmaoa asiatica]
MPGPRVKQNAAKKYKYKVMSQGNAASSPAIPTHVLKTLDELLNDDWDKVTKVPCDHLKLPNLMMRSGLTTVHHNFNEVYKCIDDTYVAYEGNQLI